MAKRGKRGRGARRARGGAATNPTAPTGGATTWLHRSGVFKSCPDEGLDLSKPAKPASALAVTRWRVEVVANGAGYMVRTGDTGWLSKFTSVWYDGHVDVEAFKIYATSKTASK
jgi:hypothetical protein